MFRANQMTVNDNRIKFRQIVCFLEVARYQSVSRAAESLNMAQSAVSRALADLEAITGARLTERSKRGSRLTDLGEKFYQFAAPGAAQIRQAYAALQPSEQAESTIVVGTLPEAVSLMPQALTEMRRAAPRTVLRVLHGTNADHMTMLRHGDLTFVIGRIAGSDLLTGLSFEHLYSERVTCVVRAGHPLQGSEPIPPGELAQMRLVLHQPETIIRAETDRFLFSQGVSRLDDAIETDSMALARRLVIDDDRVWIAPEGVVSRDLETGDLSELAVSGWRIDASVGITTDPRRRLTLVEERFLGIIRTIAKNRIMTEML
ncbi:LysR family transcriptional regulator [Zhengella mangrovi]|uniref:LysR family transcriptional regulator n=2 Tax=Zhengella mangrovi TaxID=1982044 RepID=A0A2G1QKA1_9HYPH|nr:LysR family transcriptional regulator [Zhengella mangrovi]